MFFTINRRKFRLEVAHTSTHQHKNEKHLRQRLSPSYPPCRHVATRSAVTVAHGDTRESLACVPPASGRGSLSASQCQCQWQRQWQHTMWRGTAFQWEGGRDVEGHYRTPTRWHQGGGPHTSACRVRSTHFLGDYTLVCACCCRVLSGFL